MTKKTAAVRIDIDGKKDIEETVAEEVPLTIYLDEEEVATLLCSPEDLDELAAGFLYSAGLIKSTRDIKNVAVDGQNWACHVTLSRRIAPAELIFKRLYTAGCGMGVLFHTALDTARKRKITDDSKISYENILRLMDTFQKRSVAFKKTGCVHGAALCDEERIIIFKTDIGRHNALDKIIGEALNNGIGMEGLIVISSGRVSSEIMTKAERMRVSYVVSRSAPTDQAVRLADSLNVTLIGFVRGHRMNVYTAKERLRHERA